MTIYNAVPDIFKEWHRPWQNYRIMYIHTYWHWTKTIMTNMRAGDTVKLVSSQESLLHSNIWNEMKKLFLFSYQQVRERKMCCRVPSLWVDVSVWSESCIHSSHSPSRPSQPPPLIFVQLSAGSWSLLNSWSIFFVILAFWAWRAWWWQCVAFNSILMSSCSRCSSSIFGSCCWLACHLDLRKMDYGILLCWTNGKEEETWSSCSYIDINKR